MINTSLNIRADSPRTNNSSREVPDNIENLYLGEYFIAQLTEENSCEIIENTKIFIPNNLEWIQFIGYAEGTEILLTQTALELASDYDRFLTFPNSIEKISGGSCYKLLINAIGLGHLPMCRFLVEKKLVDLNNSESGQVAPLIVASSMGNLDLVKLFLEHGANLQVLDVNEYTALDIAVIQGHSKALSLLLSEYPKNETLENLSINLINRCLANFNNLEDALLNSKISAKCYKDTKANLLEIFSKLFQNMHEIYGDLPSKFIIEEIQHIFGHSALNETLIQIVLHEIKKTNIQPNLNFNILQNIYHNLDFTKKQKELIIQTLLEINIDETLFLKLLSTSNESLLAIFHKICSKSSEKNYLLSLLNLCYDLLYNSNIKDLARMEKIFEIILENNFIEKEEVLSDCLLDSLIIKNKSKRRTQNIKFFFSIGATIKTIEENKLFQEKCANNIFDPEIQKILKSNGLKFKKEIERTPSPYFENIEELELGEEKTNRTSESSLDEELTRINSQTSSPDIRNYGKISPPIIESYDANSPPKMNEKRKSHLSTDFFSKSPSPSIADEVKTPFEFELNGVRYSNEDTNGHHNILDGKIHMIWDAATLRRNGDTLRTEEYNALYRVFRNPKTAGKKGQTGITTYSETKVGMKSHYTLQLKIAGTNPRILGYTHTIKVGDKTETIYIFDLKDAGHKVSKGKR